MPSILPIVSSSVAGGDTTGAELGRREKRDALLGAETGDHFRGQGTFLYGCDGAIADAGQPSFLRHLWVEG